MAKQKGRLMLIKIGDGAATEVFSILCGLTAKDLTINNSEVDVTTADCVDPGGAMWNEVVSGTKRLSVSGSAFFKGEAADKRVAAAVMLSDSYANLQVVVPGLGMFAGNFFLSDLKYTGPVDQGMTYDLSAASNGVIAFTPEP